MNATHALWTWHQNPDLEPKIADQLWIVKVIKASKSVEPDARNSLCRVPTLTRLWAQ
jgi:hypothetical protein